MSDRREGQGADHEGRAVIGLIGDSRPADFGAWRDIDVCLVWSHYLEAIRRAEGAAIVVPPEQYLAEQPDLLLDRIDGLLLTGGRDIDAGSYGAEPHPENDPGDPVRDRAEFAVARAAIADGVPVLGVCRGMQLLNLIAGGGIDQHLEDPGHVHRAESGGFVSHPIEVEPGTILASMLGSDPAPIRSHHHQGLTGVAAGFRVSARSPEGVVEAFEGASDDDGGFCVAVLWHPEEDLDGGGLALYEGLVAAASERRAKVAA